ncbi:MAG TPA: ankyrin repeat domain-containing protein [Pyrinomonadaceae bacterium]|jgi:ankyrin repeat protein|nr:ankyrin repeat domain-containing protein [Pyrinomonadaceae bacterium]
MIKTTPDVPAIHLAVMRKSLSEVITVLESGEDVDVLDRAGRTALFYAAQDGEVAIAAKLIRHGANVNVKDSAPKTPLHAAASSYQTEVAQLLPVESLPNMHWAMF